MPGCLNFVFAKFQNFASFSSNIHSFPTSLSPPPRRHRQASLRNGKSYYLSLRPVTMSPGDNPPSGRGSRGGRASRGGRRSRRNKPQDQDQQDFGLETSAAEMSQGQSSNILVSSS